MNITMSLKTNFLNLPFIVGLCFVFYSFAIKSEERPDSYDYLAILNGTKSLSELKKPLEIFNNRGLTGHPIFIIDNFSVKDLRINKGGSYLGFIIPNESSGSLLKIDRIEKDLAEVVDQDKRYYMKINSEMFVGNHYPLNSRWKIIKGEEALTLYRKMYQTESRLKELMQEGQSCTERDYFAQISAVFGSDKRLVCLQKFFQGNPRNVYDAGNLLWVYNNLSCNDAFHDSQIRHTTFSGEKSNKHVEVPWSALKRIFEGKIKQNEIKIRTQDFGKLSKIEIETDGPLFCDAEAQESVHVTLDINNDWKVTVWNFIKVHRKN